MKKADSTVMSVCLALLAAPVAVGCAASEDPPAQRVLASSAGAPAMSRLLVYPTPYATPMAPSTQPNPIPDTAVAVSQLFDAGGGKMRITLTVQGMIPNRGFGAHLHRLPCEDPMKAGTHYQHFPSPGPVTDPAYANVVNEAWLDFITNTQGVGETDLTLNWIPRANEAKAVIIHDMLSGGGGVSGAKLACLPITGI